MVLLVLIACSGGSPKDTASSLDTAPGATTRPGSTTASGTTPAGTVTSDCVDADGDGVDTCSGDCDDADPLRFPGAPERCDGLDTACDGVLSFDEGTLGESGLPVCATCDEAGFWLPTRGLSGDALVAVAGELTAEHSCSSYSAAKDYLWLILDRDDDLLVTCVYTGDQVESLDNVPAGFSTEHSWPRSLGAEDPPQECDLHHLFPSAEDANNRRSNYPFGEVTGDVEWSRGGSSLGDGASGELVFEPRAGHKGDAARAMLYFAARYGHTLSESEVALYQSWHALDPAGPEDRARSMRIAYEQGAANPFVVCSDLVDAL
jgi:endonuclease I